ncbi:MAG: O-antigen ligase family protein [Candidatus Rokuibacteriota bacterium]
MLSGKARRPAARETDFSLRLTYVVWALVLFVPEWWLASFGLGPLKRLGLLLFPIAAGVAFLRPTGLPVHWPLLLWVAFHAMWVASPFVSNRGYAMEVFKIELLFYVFLIALPAAVIRESRRAVPMIIMFLLSFGWWALHGLPDGKVGWHSTLGNEDGFGPIMVVGIAFASFVALGARSRRARLASVAVAVSCGIGIVASFARGAVLAAGVVLVALWLRSPRKAAMLGWVLLAAAVMVVASAVLFPGGAFWDEMRTIGDGFDDPTGSDRRDLWKAGWRVFLRSPLVGVGPANFGAYASENFAFGEAQGFYGDPGHFYGRSLHNIYFQILSEQGLIGVAIFLFLLKDFVSRNRALRTRQAGEHWAAATGAPVSLGFVSLGLETAMLGYLASGFFYDQLYETSLYAIVALNLLLHSLVTSRARSGSPAAALARSEVRRS